MNNGGKETRTCGRLKYLPYVTFYLQDFTMIGRYFFNQTSLYPSICNVQWVNFNGRVDRSVFSLKFQCHRNQHAPKSWEQNDENRKVIGKSCPFNFKLLVVPRLKFWKWQSKIFSLQKLKAILVLFKTVKSIVAMTCRIYTVSWEYIDSLPRPTAYAIHQNVPF